MEWKTRADSNSGGESREGSNPSTSTCTCGKPIEFRKTGECKTCYHRRYYHEVRRRKIYEYMGGNCMVCGSTENLEVDHIDPTNKSFEIKYNLTLDDRLKAELAKCQLLCKDHHLAKTLEQREPYIHGTVYGWMKKKCRCELCKPAWRHWHDERNAARRVTDGVRGPYGRSAEHGELLMYRRGCKCAPCKAANATYARELKQQKEVVG